ncbi:hypothetical protein B0T26DRAFT_695582 [Lasiosphaeria miniovina]|uniref:Uncharacterized protein n=1 Tax=Lasiosphaeria miniovina TaxID=1954250 RepID=A0AA40B557_9PEZI|nr:uncharacterized protein B0T26DRAFT_695582 [Lasiosphaeria miniovina]KAK0727742.1 hypothetical protein B0T26DRAFT_695582 [Lasiosphaeria miniovina]
MDDNAKTLAKDLIDLLGRVNKTGQVVDAEVRKRFWDKFCFAGGWDSDCTNNLPGNIPKRRAAEITTLVGTIKAGIPITKKALAKGGPRANRVPGATVYLKPNINREDENVTFFWCDSAGGAINSKFVHLRPGYSKAHAKTDSVIRWDEAEYQRINNHNIRWVVYWARARLVRWMFGHMPVGATDTDGNRPTMEDWSAEDHTKLETLRTCKMMLDEMRQVAADVDAITGSRKAGEVRI